MATSTRWRLNMSAGNSGLEIAVAQLAMLGSAGDTDLCTGGTASASSAANPAANAFDTNPSSFWKSGFFGVPAWLEYQFASAVEVVAYRVTHVVNPTSVGNNWPKDWTFEYWNGSTWVVVDTRTGQIGWSPNETRGFIFGTPPSGRIFLAALTAKPGASGGTTSAIDTTGANLLVASLAYVASITFSDSKGNTWTPLTERTTGSTAKHRFYYVQTPVVGTGHTFTVTGSGINCGLVVHAYRDAAGAPTVAVQNGAAAATGTSLATGSVTPATSGALVVSGLSVGDASNAPTVDVGLAATLNLDTAGTALGCTLGYKIQSPAAAINPTWSWTTSSENAASVVVFAAAAAAAVERVDTYVWGPL